MKKTVIITGGTTGIGKATAIAFGKKGYNVVITSRNEKRGEQTLSEIKQTGADAAFMKLDVSNEQEFIQVIEQTVKRFGKLNVMVNNAGISGEQSGLLADSTGENLRALFDTNILGLFFGMKYAIKAMLKTGGGSVINLASIAGMNGLL